MKIDIKQLYFLHYKLRRVLIWIEKEIGVEMTITSQLRIGDKGVHGTLPLRGTDLRMREKSIGLAFEWLINRNWIYDPKRPRKKVVVLHGKEGKDLHLHIQVHKNTRRL